MHKTLKALVWTAAILLGLPVVVYLGWLTGNLADDELSPDANRILTGRPSPQVDPQENSYFDVLGIDAPEGEDPKAWGLAQFRQLVAADSAPNGGSQPMPRETHFPAAADIPCHKAENCLAKVAAAPESAERALRQNAYLLRRLDAVLDAKYQEPPRKLSYWSPLTVGRFPLVCSLGRTRVALLASQGRHHEALRQWGRTTEFLARQMEGSYSLLTKLAAMSSLHRQHVLLARYFERHPDAIKAHAEMVRPFLRALSKSELTLASAIESEASLAANGYPRNLADLRLLYGSEGLSPHEFDLAVEPFFLPKATVNEAVARLMKWARLEALDGEAYRQSLALLSAEASRSNASPWQYRNPVGKVLLRMSYDYSSYLYWRDSLAAERRLLGFGLELIKEGTCEPSGIQEAVSRRPELVHAYTGKGPVWNGEKGVLSYAPADNPQSEPAHQPVNLSVLDGGRCAKAAQ